MAAADPAEVLKRIETPLRLTHVGLWAERLVRAFWPLWSVFIAALAALAFGLQDLVPLELAWFGMVSAVLGWIWALIHGFRRFARPTRAEALARLDARLPGQPLAALGDHQAIGAGDAASRAVWAAHRARMAARAATARPVEPDLRLAARDPFALRYVALTALVMAVIFGSIWRVASVETLAPGGGGAAAAAGPAWEGWAQPPAYTGKPALYLGDQTAEVLTLPVGTRLQIRLYGSPGALILTETVSGSTDAPPASQASHDFKVVNSGALAIEGEGGRQWRLVATPDAAPSVTPAPDIGREADGRFKQEFTAADDYGVTRGAVTITLDLAAVDRSHGLAAEPDPQAPVVLDLPLPPRGKRSDIASALVDDLSTHVFANLPVILTYEVGDAAGQTGTAAPVHAVLPGKRFYDPLAAALVEMRRDILWARANAPHSVEVLKAITHRPEDFITNRKAYLRLRVAIKRLDAAAAALDEATRAEVAEELWQVALILEEGDLASAKARLEHAQDRLDEAIRRGASPEEIQELMDEMRQALNDYMRQQAENAPPDPNDETSRNDQGPTITQDQLQQMLDKLQELMEQGRTAEAQQLMEQLRQMMENMQVVQGDGQGQSGPGRQAMKELGDTLRDQQGLSDDAWRDLQDGQEGNDGQNPGGKSLAERQEELRDRLDRLGERGGLPGKDSEKGQDGRDKLGEAERSMEEAERALREGDLPGALDKQAEAMDAMREGLRDFGDALAETERRQGDGQEGQVTQNEDPNGTRDPLGRENSLHIGSDKNLLQGEDVYRRAQELLNEIRKRSGDQSRPDSERGYLKRLLDLF